MNTRSFSIIYFFSLLLLNCCKDPEGICNEPSNSISFERFCGEGNCKFCVFQNLDLDKLQVNLVINNQSDFEKFVSCFDDQNNSVRMAIDFNNQTVLAGMLQTPNIDLILKQEVTKTCNKYLYYVEIGHGSSPAGTNTYHFVIIPKIESGTEVVFSVKYLAK